MNFSNELSRRSFLQAAGVAGFALLATACGGDHKIYGEGSPPPGKMGGNCEKDGVLADVQMLHDPNHDLTIPAADVTAGVEKTYMLGDNGSGHIHEITLSPADFAQLRAGQPVHVVSTSSGHVHGVSVSCA